MCLICTTYQSGKLTLKEARRNFGEMKSTLSEDHQDEVEALLYPEYVRIEDADFRLISIDWVSEGGEPIKITVPKNEMSVKDLVNAFQNYSQRTFVPINFNMEYSFLPNKKDS